MVDGMEGLEVDGVEVQGVEVVGGAGAGVELEVDEGWRGGGVKVEEWGLSLPPLGLEFSVSAALVLTVGCAPAVWQGGWRGWWGRGGVEEEGGEVEEDGVDVEGSVWRVRCGGLDMEGWWWMGEVVGWWCRGGGGNGGGLVGWMVVFPTCTSSTPTTSTP